MFEVDRINLFLLLGVNLLTPISLSCFCRMSFKENNVNAMIGPTLC